MLRIYISILLFSLSIRCVFAQQDAQYSQYMFNQLAINPAFAGSRDALSATMVYRNQWTGIEGAPTTNSLSAQMPLKNRKVGLGTEILSDKIGPENISAFLFSYAYRIPFSRGKLAFGLRAGVYNYSIDWNKIDYKDKSDIYNSGMRSSKITGTVDFGLYYSSRTFYWGFSMNHLNMGKITTAGNDNSVRQATHLFIALGKSFLVGNTIINPTLLIKSATNSPCTADISINVLLKEKLWLGLSLRSSYGFVFLTQYMINDKFKVGYSYDYGVNKIGLAGKGSHEIMIGYDLSLHGSKMILPRYL